MKVLTPFLVFFMLLLCGANFLFASNYSEDTLSTTSAFISYQKQHQISAANQITTVLDLTDIDIEEDYLGKDDTVKNPQFLLGYNNLSLVPKWFEKFTDKLTSFKLFVVPTYFLFSTKNTTPFYISLRALRI